MFPICGLTATPGSREFVRMLGIRFFVVYLEVLTIAKLDHQLNEEIRDKEIRLIGADGAQLGIVSAAEANAMAEHKDYDGVRYPL